MNEFSTLGRRGFLGKATAVAGAFSLGWTVPAQAHDETKQLEQKRAVGTETILLVEDEPQVRKLVHAVLVRAGYTVLVAANGAEAVALEKAHDGKIDLVLTDVVMPGMSGSDVAIALTAARPGVSVLYMSGYTDDSIVHHGVLDEGVAFLQKPVLPTPLLAAIRNALGKRAR